MERESLSRNKTPTRVKQAHSQDRKKGVCCSQFRGKSFLSNIQGGGLVLKQDVSMCMRVSDSMQSLTLS